MRVSAREPDRTREVVRPGSPWLRLVVVVVTLSIAGGMTLAVVAVAGQLGIDPKDLQGPGAVVSVPTVTVFLLYLTLQVLLVFGVQRVVHKRPVSDLGLRAPVVKHLVIGFAIGMGLWVAPLLLDLANGSKTIEWNPPAGVSPLTLIAYYCLFLILLTASSFGEEMVFRCYPIDQFRDSPPLMLAAIVLSAVLFASVHFVIGELSVGRFLTLAVGACFMSYVYAYYRSIWLLIGLHNASNFLPCTFSGNWKMGGLFSLSGEASGTFAELLAFVAPVVAMVLFYRFRPRPAVDSTE